MAAASEAYSSSTSDSGVIALLGQELYDDTDESQACALESIVDILLLEVCKAFEEQAERHHQK